MTNKLEADYIKSLAAAFGLKVSAVSPFLPSAENISRLNEWQSKNHYGEMDYMNREILSRPENLFPEYKSILTFSVYYSRKERRELAPGFGRVARYAWGRDYHKVLRRKLEAFAQYLIRDSGVNFKYRVFSDSVPLLERAVANAAGNGFIGKNTMLIRPKLGSFNFIAEIFTDIEIAPQRLNVISENCGDCRRCQGLCPTSAFVSEYELDARKCISYLTIEKRGILDTWESAAIGDWLFGCDICQEVCPFNHAALKAGLPADIVEFEEKYGAGQSLNLAELLSIVSAQEFLERFAGTAIMRTKYQGLIRNALIVSANTQAFGLKNLIESVYQKNKGHDEVLSHHALQALEKLA